MTIVEQIKYIKEKRLKPEEKHLYSILDSLNFNIKLFDGEIKYMRNLNIYFKYNKLNNDFFISRQNVYEPMIIVYKISDDELFSLVKKVFKQKLDIDLSNTKIRILGLPHFC